MVYEETFTNDENKWNVRKRIGKVFSEALLALDMIYMKRKYIDVSFYFAKYPGLKNMQMMDLIFLSGRK